LTQRLWCFSWLYTRLSLFPKSLQSCEGNEDTLWGEKSIFLKRHLQYFIFAAGTQKILNLKLFLKLFFLLNQLLIRLFQDKILKIFVSILKIPKMIFFLALFHADFQHKLKINDELFFKDGEKLKPHFY